MDSPLKDYEGDYCLNSSIDEIVSSARSHRLREHTDIIYLAIDGDLPEDFSAVVVTERPRGRSRTEAACGA